MSEDHNKLIHNEYCSTTRLSYPLSNLTGIHEDTRGELVHSLIDYQQYHNNNEEQSMHTCAVPINVCCVCSNENDEQLLHSDVQVLCASPGCKYSGPIHRKCLEHWDKCCDFYCHLLNNSSHNNSNNSLLQSSLSSETTSPSMTSSFLSNFNDSPLHKSFMEGLFRLYECPSCSQYTLYRSSIHSATTPNQSSSVGTSSSSTSNHFTSVLCAIQYATEKLSQSESLLQPTSLDPNSMQFQQYSSNSPADYIESMELSPNFSDDLKSHPISGRSHSYTQPQMITNRFSDVLRRFSLNRATSDTTKFSTSNTSSSMSSGYHSGPSTGEHTVDPSRRCSDNSYDAFMTMSAKGEDVMKGNEDSSVPWGITNVPTNQPLSRALIKGTTINTLTKVPDETMALNDVIQRSIDSSIPTRRTYSLSISLDDSFDSSLDATVNNNNESSNNVIGNSNNMGRPISAIGSRRHHSTSASSGDISVGAVATTDITHANNKTPTVATSHPHSNLKTSTLWSIDPTSKSRTTHWHTNNAEAKTKKVVNTNGNIFLQRHDFNVFTNLPSYKQNAYFIQMDDDSCTGNEDTRAFLLAQLTNHRVSEVYCLACQQILPIYDHFPVIDGIFFISPLCHRSNEGYRKGGGLRVTWHTNGVQNQSIHQQQQQQQHTHRTHITTNTTTSNGDNQLISSTNDYQSINQIALKLLAPLKIISPPPGCLGPRQQLNSTQHNIINTSGGGQGSNNSHSGSISSRYSTGIASTRQGRYLHALCMNCMHTEDLIVNSQLNDLKGIKCKICSKPWSGASLLVGGLYTYDIFAAVPCCSAHLTCGSCQSRLDDLSLSTNSITSSSTSPPSTLSTTYDLPHQHYYQDQNQNSSKSRINETINQTTNDDLTIKSYPLSYFSQYSNLIICPYCSKVDYHFVKLFEDYYDVTKCC
uniref:Headcase protein n=1 Tax=Schistosoma japonicum TaxID=6182 RepID=C1LH91_SCHJA|nr:Headcase protein [Schistosoma japonicum]